MILKDLLLIVLGGGGFVGLMGTSGYFVYRQEKVKEVENDISNTLGEINHEIQKLIGKKVNEKGEIVNIYESENSTLSKEVKKQKAQTIKEKINKGKEKNKKFWKNYINGVDEILTRYQEIVEKEEKNSESKKLPKPKPAKPKAAKPK